MDDPPSTLRTKPRQARAIETVRHILDTSAVLLDEVGVDRFNTNLLAERADIRVRTVYRYFDNKQAIILILATAMYERADDSLRTTLGSLASPDEPWLPAVHRVIDDYFATMAATPGWRGIRHAIGAVPGLEEIRREVVGRHTRWLAEALVARGIEQPSARVRVIARTAFAASSAALEPMVGASPRARVTMIAELKVMMGCYFARYLE
jgi:AcrR family transcriptional regulator